jgi:tetratricopeptide (TPR) repeat protein
MRRWLLLLSLAVALMSYLFIFPRVWESRETARATIPAGYVIPSKFSRILALGHQGVLSDFMFLKTATFIGGRSGAGQTMQEEDWQFVTRSLDVITDLDPYFKDPYVLAEGLLAWDAGKPEEANKLLRKGLEYRDKDWRLPFFIGFNNFYFLKNYEEASDYIMRAAELPGSPAYLKTLGARLAYYGGKSQTALLFLKEMLAGTDDPLLQKRLQLRLTALERAVMIENALDKFKQQEKRMPNQLSELVTMGYLIVLPEDPYGGKWGILKNGRVFSTSKLVGSPQTKNESETDTISAD